jgi:hypothetical protein
MIVPPVKEILSKKKYVWTAAILLLMFIVLGTALGRAIPLNVTTSNRSPKDPSKVPPGFHGIALYGNVSNVDTKGYLLKLLVEFRPKGDYLYTDDPMKRSLTKPVNTNSNQ